MQITINKKKNTALLGRGMSIWDYYVSIFPTKIKDESTANVACDSYHKLETDVEMLRKLGVDYYRFSLSWTRILPTGYPNHINPDGVRYYNNLIDTLLQNGIEPWITLYHWDLPQSLQDLGGWTNIETADRFAEFARISFALFGDRVKTWITINEPYSICAFTYEDGTLAPFILSKGLGSYQCGHTVILAHAKAYHIYDKEFRPKQNGNFCFFFSF